MDGTGVSAIIQAIGPGAIGAAGMLALRKLIGQVADVPGAGLELISQSIRDEAAVRSTVSKAVGARRAATAVAQYDADLVARAARSHWSAHIRKQANKEAIAKRAFDELQEDAPATETPVSDDFLNRFERFAEDASSEEMQRLFARILAGEIRRPGTFSLATLQALSVMDANVAATVEKVRNWLSADWRIPLAGPLATGDPFLDILRLEDIGLLRSRSITSEATFTEFGSIFVPHTDEGFLLSGAPGSRWFTAVYQASTVGVEVFGLLKPTLSPEVIDLLKASYAATTGVTEVTLVSLPLTGPITFDR